MEGGALSSAYRELISAPSREEIIIIIIIILFVYFLAMPQHAENRTQISMCHMCGPKKTKKKKREKIRDSKAASPELKFKCRSLALRRRLITARLTPEHPPLIILQERDEETRS